MKKSKRVLAVILVLVLLFGNNTGIVGNIPGISEIQADAVSSATQSSGSGGSSGSGISTGGTGAASYESYEKYNAQTGITHTQLAAVIDGGTPLFYSTDSGETVTQITYTVVSSYAYYWHAYGSSYSNNYTIGYGGYNAVDSTFVNRLYVGVSAGGSNGNGNESSNITDVAVDGVYSSTLTGYKKGQAKYTAVLEVEVKDGIINGLWISDASSNKMFKAITTDIYYQFVGAVASPTVISGLSDADAVSSATTSSSYSSTSKYSVNLKEAIVNALNKAQKRSNSTPTGETVTYDSIYSGAYSVGDEEGSVITINVFVKNGKIVDIAVDSEKSVGSWESLLSKVKEDYIGKSTSVSDIDAISSATQYSNAVNVAIKNALSNAAVQTVVYTGSRDVGDEEGSSLTLNVSVADNKIIGIAADEAQSVGSWGTLISNVQSGYVGKSATEEAVDAVSAATQYSKAVKDAVKEAIKNIVPDTSGSTGGTTAPKILDGDNQTWAKQSGKSLTVRSSSELSNFVKLLIDGNQVLSKYYTLRSGSTIVEIGSEYLETLEEGEHTVSIVSTNGTATAKMSVAKATASGSENSSGSSTSSITDGTYEATEHNSTSYDEDITVTIVVKDGKITSFTVTPQYTGGTYYYGPKDTETNFQSVLGKEATADTINDVVYNSSAGTGRNYQYFFNTVKKAALAAVAKASSGSGTGSSAGEIKTYTGNGASVNITIKVGETVKLISSYSTSSYRYWKSYQWDGDTQLYTDDDDGNGNTITVTGKAVGTQTYKYYDDWLSDSNQPETFYVTVEENESGGNEGDEEKEYEAPNHHKSIAGSGDDYTISLNVTGNDVSSTSQTTTPGQTIEKGTNLVLLIDTSGSISGKETALNGAIQSLVRGLPTGSQVGIVTFNTSASNGRIYTKEDISTLSFSAQSGTSTYMSYGITNAAALLNTTSNWSADNRDNNKAIVVISDFDTDDSSEAINNAKTAKNSGIKIYSVRVDATSIGTATTTFSNKANDSNAPNCVARYVSSQYPSATENNGTYGSIWGYSVSPGTADNSADYVYGAAGGNWSDIFAKIKESQNITTTTTTTLHTKNVVIEDTLSDYVELSNTNASQNYGITVTGLESSQYAVSVSGKKVTVTFDGGIELVNGTTYIVNIPVKPTSKARQEANNAADDSKEFDSNVNAFLTYSYGDNEVKTVIYDEIPQITVNKQSNTHVLNYDANGGQGAPASQTMTNTLSSYTFTISSAEPTREGYRFLGWTDSKASSDVKYVKGYEISVSGTKTIYAVWEQIKNINVSKKWADGFDSTGYTVEISAVNGNNILDTVTLNSSSNWKGTLTVTGNTEYTISETKVTDSAGNDVTSDFKAVAEKENGTETWSEAGTTPVDNTVYAVGFQSGDKVYLLNGDGTKVTSVEADKEGGQLKNVKAGSQWLFTDTGTTSNNLKVFTLYNNSAGKYLQRNASGLILNDTASNVRINSNNNFQVTNGSAYRSFWCKSGEISSGSSGTIAVTLYTKDSSSSSGESWTITNTPSSTNYTVKHWQQNVGLDGYTEVSGDRQTISGTAGQKTDAAAKAYTGFTAKSFNQETILSDGSTVVNIYYDRNLYEIKWLDGDGNTLKTEQLAYGATPGYTGETPTKTATSQYNYIFNHKWLPEVKTVTENAVYTAQFDEVVKTYTITWKDDDGSVIDTTTVEYGTLPTHDEPVKSDTDEYHYTFTGWSPEVVAVTNDAEYKAGYNDVKKQYKVTFVDEDGTVLKEAASYDYGTKAEDIEKPETPTKTETAEYTYEFDGWTPEVADVTADVTYTAKYKDVKRSYTVVWQNDDRTVLETDEDVEYGTVPGYDGATPTKEQTAEYSYEFIGWTPQIKAVEGNMTYTAVYNAVKKQYKVTFVDEDGTVLKAETLYDYGTEAENIVKPETPTKEATVEYTYEFDGWTPEVAKVTNDVVYKATYKAVGKTYTVTWKNEDGSVLKEATYKYGETPVYGDVNPVKAGNDEYTYEFTGWTPEVVAVTKDAEYTAVYQSVKNKYTIKFVDENEVTVLDEQELEYGVLPEFKGTVPVKTGDAQHSYVFAGWTPEIVNVTGDAIYKAVYAESTNVYTVRWMDTDGTTVIHTDENVIYGSKPAFHGTNPVKTDQTNEYTYTFAGWSRDENATEPENLEESVVTGDVTYYPVFKGEKTGYHIIVEDYTKYGATTSIDAEAFYNGEVSFTVSADIATVVALHADGSEDTYMDPNGTYERMYCTDNGDGTYTFTVTMPGDGDVYIVTAYKGDLDLNGKVNTKDALAISKTVTGRDTVSKLSFLVGDVDANGKINTKDSSNCSQAVTGKIRLNWDTKQ